MRAMAKLATGRVGVVLRRFPAVDTGRILRLLFGVTRAALHPSQFVRVRHFLDIRVAGDALEAGVRGRFQGGGMEARGYPRLATPDAAAGIVAAGTVLGFWRRRVLTLKAGGKYGRDDSGPNRVRGHHGVAFFNR